MKRNLILTLFLGLAFSAAAQSQYHDVVGGDTIYTLARRYNVSQEDLMAANGLEDPRSLRVGMRLRIPAAYEEYRAERGDSLWAIARRFDTTVEELRRLNDLGADYVLRIGDVLRVPGTVVSDEPDGSGGQDHSATPAQVAAATSVVWPHPGRRSTLEGRLSGVEIAGAPGDEVRAVASGVVRFAQSFGIYGKVVIIQSTSGYYYLYGGNDVISVSSGERVVAGDVLGILGRVGAAPARAVFSVWHNSQFVDPETAPRG